MEKQEAIAAIIRTLPAHPNLVHLPVIKLTPGSEMQSWEDKLQKADESERCSKCARLDEVCKRL